MTDLVAGVDSSTQSCKAVVCDAETGEVCRSAVDRVTLVGGAAASEAVQEFAADLLGAPVAVPTPGEYVAPLRRGVGTGVPRRFVAALTALHG